MSITHGSGGHTQLVRLLLSAIVPVIEIVAAVFLISMLPFQHTLSLMLYHDAFLEISIIVFAPVTSIHWDLQCVKFLLNVLLWLVNIVRHYTNIINVRSEIMVE